MSKYLASIFFASALFSAPSSDLLSFGAGAYDLWRQKSRTFEFDAEYKFHVKCLTFNLVEIRPLVGLMTSARGCVYIYTGLNFDLLFADHLLLAPGFAAGFYNQGDGKNLGFPLEFRSGIELAWQFNDLSRLGIHFYHISNASIGRKNPGEESLLLYYDLPVRKGFPFGPH